MSVAKSYETLSYKAYKLVSSVGVNVNGTYLLFESNKEINLNPVITLCLLKKVSEAVR